MSGDFFSGEEPDTYCGDCGEPHEWVRPGKTQPTCECEWFCTAHNPPVRRHYRGENHPVNIMARLKGWGMSLGEHCAECHKEFDQEMLSL